MTTEQTPVNTLAASTAASSSTILSAYQSGRIDAQTFVGLLAALLAVANRRAYALADLTLASELTAALRWPVTPLAIAPPLDDDERLAAAATTLLDLLPETLDPEARVERLAKAEPLRASQTAATTAMAASPHVDGWTRAVSSGGCELCQAWAEEGRTFAADESMAAHPGCSCRPIPTLTERP